MSVVTVATVKLRLDQSLTVNDAELQSLIDAAEAEYVEYVGPLPGTYTAHFNGTGTSPVILPSPYVTAVTAAAYTDGTVIAVGDLDLHNGLIGWGYGTTGRFTTGTRNLEITYTVGSLPLNHLETIADDVAGYFQATQNGAGGLPGDVEGFASAYRATPLVMFPRIRALAPPRVG